MSEDNKKQSKLPKAKFDHEAVLISDSLGIENEDQLFKKIEEKIKSKDISKSSELLELIYNESSTIEEAIWLIYNYRKFKIIIIEKFLKNGK
jgi:hypothetical protein